jgi:hypothetical protein
MVASGGEDTHISQGIISKRTRLPDAFNATPLL